MKIPRFRVYFSAMICSCFFLCSVVGGHTATKNSDCVAFVSPGPLELARRFPEHRTLKPGTSEPEKIPAEEQPFKIEDFHHPRYNRFNSAVGTVSSAPGWEEVRALNEGSPAFYLFDSPANGKSDDNDGDGHLDRNAKCPYTANPDQADSDQDGKGDACDPDVELWVDFVYDGPETGSFDQPFNTLSEAVDAAPAGALITIKAGTSSETLP